MLLIICGILLLLACGGFLLLGDRTIGVYYMPLNAGHKFEVWGPYRIGGQLVDSCRGRMKLTQMWDGGAEEHKAE